MSDPGGVEAGSNVASPAPLDLPSTPKLDRVLCRMSWCLATVLVLLVLVAVLLRMGAIHWAGRLAGARVVDLQIERPAGEPTILLATVRIEVANRTPISFTLNSLRYSVSIGGTEVHKGEWQPVAPARLGPYGTTTIEVPARLETSRLVGAVLQGLSSDDPSAQIHARLRLGSWIGPITVPVSIRASLPSGGLAATQAEGR